ncbi:transcription factor xanC [Aspergillus clavatus NRRL 1]|uniref:Uncharacterized protein n=1 Tax=Aspergillus clavatus (strain ATCC 1007 / CBS 513.65 / DSM 816 / NCTC 3887 / NRRL 1 / QM 1276 / 107) TaxID=344612 RepID=A1C571_ASPCL|nr:uncharacterized protein ACLA_002500 [Aspergillus clavatus NRRL 1]EAW14839.1 hypothetical protein ACLA_002500 [Aspergillus clavatus NRRL 1]
MDAVLGTTRLHLGNQLENDINFPQYPEPPGTQPHQQSPQYYVATEASLPQIMQTLGHGPSRPKAIILIPHGHLPEGPTSTHFSGAVAGDPAVLRGSSAVQNPGCHCSMQDNGARTPDLGAPAEWISSSSPPSYCPLHSMQPQAQAQPQPLDQFQRMLL